MADLEYQCHWGWVWSWQGGLSVVSVNGMKVNCRFLNAPMILSWVCWRFWRLFLFRADIASRLYAMLRWRRSGHCDGRRRDSHVIQRWAGSAETRWFDFVKVQKTRVQPWTTTISSQQRNSSYLWTLRLGSLRYVLLAPRRWFMSLWLSRQSHLWTGSSERGCVCRTDLCPCVRRAHAFSWSQNNLTTGSISAAISHSGWKAIQF